MPSSTIIPRGTVFQSGGAVFLARLYAYGGALLTQSGVSGIVCNVFDLNSVTVPATPVVTRTLTVSAVIFNTLQTDAQWTVDTTGYNFADQMPASVFTASQHLYRIEYKITPVTGAIFWLAYEAIAERLFTNG